MMWDTLHFDHPYAAVFLLFVLPLIWGFIFLFHYRRKRLESFANSDVRDVVLEKRVSSSYWVKTGLICLCWICAVIALMGPKGKEHYVSGGGAQQYSGETKAKNAKMRLKRHEVIFLLDASSSMSIPDGKGGKTREAIAKEVVDQVISNLRGESVSLFAFTSGTIQIVPSTMDYLFTRLMLRNVSINEAETAGTQIQQALQTIRDQFFIQGSSSTRTVVILSDGGDTRLYGTNSEERNKIIQEIVSPLRDAEEMQARVYAVGIGSALGDNVPGITYKGRSVVAALDEPVMHRLALVGRGDYIDANEVSSFQASQIISKGISRNQSYIDVSTHIDQTSIRNSSNPIYDLYFQYPLSIALLALASSILIPSTKRKRVSIKVAASSLLLLCVVSTNLFADLKQAGLYFDAGDYEKAYVEYHELLDDTLNRWEQALLWYNMGTVRLADHQWDEAINNFNRSLFMGGQLPQLMQQAAANRLLALVMLCKERTATLEKHSGNADDEYIAAIVAYRKMEIDFETYSTQWCALNSAEGAMKCPTSFGLQQMEHEIKRVYAEFLPKYHAYWVDRESQVKKGGSSQQSALQHLLSLYALAIASDPMKASDLKGIVELQNENAKAIELNDKETYTLSQKFLNKGYQELEKGRRHSSLGYLLTAMFFLDTLSNAGVANQTGLEDLLKNSIHQEKFVLTLLDLLGSGTQTEKGKDVLSSVQTVVLDTAATFLPILLFEEKTRFQADGAIRCQKHPWDQVVPLFNEGYAAATSAGAAMKKEQVDEMVKGDLQLAIQSWQAALDSMHNHQTAVEEKIASAAPQQQTQNNANAIIRNIQEMELDDNSKTQITIGPSITDDRPW